MLKEFDGTNFVKLSRKFRVRVNTVYDIIKRFKRRANITPERTEFMRTCVESIANLMVRKHNFSQPEAEKIGNEVGRLHCR
ncbi:Mor transcription activator family protein [Pseudomonas aeruginosa]|uniref:Mor transcription activator family protein n=1 Tax=Pseudomonas aeruginosa TaxID=287 RepID=UPI0039E08815